MSSPAVCAQLAEHDGLRRHHRGGVLESSSSTIMIYVTAPGVAAMPMRVLASDSIAAVKLRVQTSQGVVVRKQKLVFGGRELSRNECPIRDYGVGDGNVVHLVIRVSDLRLITVETVHGHKFRFRVQPGRTVGYLKQQIQIVSSSSNNVDDEEQQQRLVLDGEELDDRHLIHDVCKTDGAVIHLIVHHRDQLEVSIVAAGSSSLLHEEEVPSLLPSSPTKVKNKIIEPVVVTSKALHELIDAVVAGMEKGNYAPVMLSEGTGGAYLMRDEQSNIAAVFKPVDEEPMAANNPRGLPVSSTGEGLKKGTRVGEGAFREVAAYLLDHGGFAGVPPTALVRCMNYNNTGFFFFFRHQHDDDDDDDDDNDDEFNKLGSLQAFVNNCGSCEDMGPRAFPVQEVHKISVLDMRLANADRHAGNILVSKDDHGVVSLVPIDHGYCLPESFEDCTFEWLYWPQSREPFNNETVEYVASLDAEEDIAILKLHGWDISRECARTLRVATMLLKKGVERGLTAFHIGSLMCRETLTKESTIEEILRQAQQQNGAADEEDAFLRTVAEIMDRRLHQLSSHTAE